MHFQLSWETAPGLGGLRCEGFSAMATEQPETAAGVAVECAGEAEAERLVRALEAHFAGKRFTNAAVSFETVKTFVLEWAIEQRT